MAAAPDPLLQLQDVRASYGGVRVLESIALDVSDGESVAILGANGAGKTTLFRAISGLMVRRTGKILFAGRDIAAMAAHQIVGLGVAHVPEGKHLFLPLSVRENLDMGALPLHRSGRGAEADDALRLVFDLFPRLLERRRQVAGTLSGGEQQMLVIGRALMSRPRLLLLDEPSAGLAPMMVEQVFRTLRELRALGLTILVAEQNVALGLGFADRAVVLHLGRKAMEGSAAALRASDAIQRLYLGEGLSN